MVKPTFGALPHEIILEVIRFCTTGAQATLLATNSAFKAFVQPLLYKHVAIRSSERAPYASFELAVRSKEIAQIVRSFRVISLAERAGSHLGSVALCLGALENLQTFQLYAQSDKQAFETVMSTTPRLPNLQTLTIGCSQITPDYNFIASFVSRHGRTLRNLSIQTSPFTEQQFDVNETGHLSVPRYNAMPRLEYIAVPWDHFQGILGRLTKVHTAAIDFGKTSSTATEATLVALKDAPFASTSLKTLICTKHQQYDQLLGYVTKLLPWLESLTIRCDATTVFTHFHLLTRMKELKHFALSSTSSWIATHLIDIKAEQLLVLPKTLERVELYGVHWVRDDEVWRQSN